MSELINNSEERREILKGIVKDLHNGVSVSKLKKTFHNLIRDISPEEIADMENELINEGFPMEDVQRLCDVHAEVFEDSLKKVGKPAKIPGHPVYTYMQEHKEVRKIIKTLTRLIKKITGKNPKDHQIREFESGFKKLKEIDKHYLRLENQLFPVLESKQFTGPTKVMWGRHDEIRQYLKQTEACYKDKDWQKLKKEFKTLASAIKKLIFLEEKILFPTSVRKINDAEWARIKRGGGEIGYAWVTPSNLWDASLTSSSTMAERIESIVIEKPQSTVSNMIKLDTGELTAEQVNLTLKNLPFDVTFVDENDTVRYYSDTRDRIFPRSPGIIGRAVQNCHPPKSVHIVNDIVQSFKDKKKDVAEFWIKQGEVFVHIRYFPVFNDAGEYKGVIEVSQEISGIRALEGEKRLLDW
jgi:DUF438 domain-containing protein